MRAGRPQQAQLGECRLARADKNKDACRGIEKQRKEPHLTISETGSSIIFHIIVREARQREKSYGKFPVGNRKSYPVFAGWRKASLVQAAFICSRSALPGPADDRAWRRILGDDLKASAEEA